MICVFVSTFKLLRLKKYVIHPLIFIIPYQLDAQFELTSRRRQGESTPSTHDSFGVLIGGQGDLFLYPTSKFFETKLYTTHSSFVTNIGQRGQRPSEARRRRQAEPTPFTHDSFRALIDIGICSFAMLGKYSNTTFHDR